MQRVDLAQTQCAESGPRPAPDSETVVVMTWWQYVETISKGATQDAIARTVGNITAPTIGRWRNSEPKPASVVAFAKAYGRPVLEAFVAAGFLTDEDARTQVTTVRHEDPSDEEILEILRRRLERDRQESGSRGNTPAIGEKPLNARRAKRAPSAPPSEPSEPAEAAPSDPARRARRRRPTPGSK